MSIASHPLTARGRRTYAYFRGKIMGQALSDHPGKILHYDIRTGDLVAFFW